MKVEDPVAQLRMEFSGFRQWFHFVAICLFLFPYVWFIVSGYIKASFVCSNKPCTTLLSALCVFLWTGGTGKHFSVSFLSVCGSIFYNINRIYAVYLAKKLELQEHTLKIPVHYEFSSLQKVNFFILKWGFYFNICLLLIHCYHFLMMKIPIVE